MGDTFKKELFSPRDVMQETFDEIRKNNPNFRVYDTSQDKEYTDMLASPEYQQLLKEKRYDEAGQMAAGMLDKKIEKFISAPAPVNDEVFRMKERLRRIPNYIDDSNDPAILKQRMKKYNLE